MKIKSIFYIYSEASMAVLFAIGSLIELICFAGLTFYNAPLFAMISLVASIGFLMASLGFALSVYRAINK